MSPLIAAIGCFALYAVGYFVYSRYLGSRIFRLDPTRRTPAHVLEDGVDYVPTNRFVLFGHHYASITGLAPMLGPAVAVFWGWLPAMLWVVFGAILIGCVHDFSALVVSMRARGLSIGKVAEGVIGPRAKFLFLALIFFGIALAMGVFVYVIATLFEVDPAQWDPRDLAGTMTDFPSAVLPSAALMVLAMAMGYLLYKRRFRLGPTTAVGFLLMLVSVWLGTVFPTLGLDAADWPGRGQWTVYLLTYAFLASVLPVWSLLQARDFLNSLLLYLGLAMTYIGFFVLRPEFAADAVNPEPTGAPPLFPFVFIVIACGAASGFHGLVSSGTTAKQIATETDARFVAYGGMIGESLLGLLAVLACTAGFDSFVEWQAAYPDWGTIEGSLAKKLGAFINGCAKFISTLGVDLNLAVAFIAVIVVSFALTTLDSATRLLRFNISEIGSSIRLKVLENRFVATTLAVIAIGFFAFYEIESVDDAGNVVTRAAGLALWTLFGITNQLLAGLTLLAVTVYLVQRGRNPFFTGIPAAFMLVSTFTAMINQLRGFSTRGQYLLLTVGGMLFVLGVWIVVEAAVAFMRPGRTDDDVIHFRDSGDAGEAAGGE